MTPKLEIKNNDFTISEKLTQLKHGPEWLVNERTLSKESFNNSPLPPRGLHLWRYTDPSTFLFEPVQMNDNLDNSLFQKMVDTEKVNFDNGNISALASDFSGISINITANETLAKSGVILCSLIEAIEKHSDIVEKHLYQLINKETGKFEAINSALWNDGIFLYIPDNVTVEKPIHILHGSAPENKASFHRLLIVAGKNSEATIFDEYLSSEDSDSDNESFSNCAVEIFGEDHSRVRYMDLQRQNYKTNNYFTHRARIGQSATMLTIPLAFGGALSKQNFGVELSGAGAESRIYGLLFGSGRQHFDNHTIHHHTVGNTYSDIVFPVVLKDKALSAYTGLIRIENGAKTCEAYQKNENLLLNRGTRAETIPELEILNEDVSCSHGATIGPIDQESIFYLKCRGIEKSEAVKMIVAGFVQSTLKLLPDDLRDRLTSYINTRLETI